MGSRLADREPSEPLVQRGCAAIADQRTRQAVTPILNGRIDWQAEYGCILGVQAFIYGFPYIYTAKLRHDWVGVIG